MVFLASDVNEFVFSFIAFFGSFTYQQTNKSENHWHSSMRTFLWELCHIVILTSAKPYLRQFGFSRIFCEQTIQRSKSGREKKTAQIVAGAFRFSGQVKQFRNKKKFFVFHIFFQVLNHIKCRDSRN